MKPVLTWRSLIQEPQGIWNQFQVYIYSVLMRPLFDIRLDTAGRDLCMTENQDFIHKFMGVFQPDTHPSNVFPFLRVFPGFLAPSNGRMDYIHAHYGGEAGLDVQHYDAD
jgi:hypothetical protein